MEEQLGKFTYHLPNTIPNHNNNLKHDQRDCQ